MFTKIGTITIGVSDQDKALDFYVNKLGFEKVDDQPMSETERWLEIALPGTQTHIMLGLRGQSGGNTTGMRSKNIWTCPAMRSFIAGPAPR